jgi:hypothetical protein
MLLPELRPSYYSRADASMVAGMVELAHVHEQRTTCARLSPSDHRWMMYNTTRAAHRQRDAAVGDRPQCRVKYHL